MANYNIVVDTSNFKPFDMSFTMGILNAYKEQYNRYEDALNKIAEENGMLNLPTPEEGNEEQQRIYNMYQKYLEDFRNTSDDFAQGMTYRNAPLVAAINRRYGLEVKPIKQAVEDFKKFKENKNTLRANKDNIYFAKDPSVYDFIGGNIPDLVTLNGAKVQEEAKNVIGNLYSGPLAKDPEFKHLAQGWLTMVENGYDPKATLDDFILDYENRHGSTQTNEFKKALNFIYDSYNLGDNWGEEEKRAIWGDVIKGAISGLPKRTNTNIQDRNFESDADRETRLLNARLAINKDKREAEMQPIEMASKKASIAYTNAQTHALKHPKSPTPSSYTSQYNDTKAFYRYKATFGTTDEQEEAKKVLKMMDEAENIGSSDKGKGTSKGTSKIAGATLQASKDGTYQIYSTTMYLPSGVMITKDGKPNAGRNVKVSYKVRKGKIISIESLGALPFAFNPDTVKKFFEPDGTAFQLGVFNALNVGELQNTTDPINLPASGIPFTSGYENLPISYTDDYNQFVDGVVTDARKGAVNAMESKFGRWSRRSNVPAAPSQSTVPTDTTPTNVNDSNKENTEKPKKVQSLKVPGR